MKKKQAKKLAVFDIDGTIFRSSLLIELINGLVETKIFPKKAKREIERDYQAWLDRRGSYENYINRVVKIYFRYIGGCRQKAVENVADAVVAVHKDRVYRYTRDLIKQLRRQNYLIVAVSASPLYMVSRFARYMGFDAYFGSIYEVKNGVFTGRSVSSDTVEHKPKVLKNFIKKNNLTVDLKNSIAVGDTEGDISLLKTVGKPIAFNPNLSLIRYANRRNWQIIVERKDVVYKLKNYSVISG